MCKILDMKIRGSKETGKELQWAGHVEQMGDGKLAKRKWREKTGYG